MHGFTIVSVRNIEVGRKTVCSELYTVSPASIVMMSEESGLWGLAEPELAAARDRTLGYVSAFSPDRGPSQVAAAAASDADSP